LLSQYGESADPRTLVLGSGSSHDQEELALRPLELDAFKSHLYGIRGIFSKAPFNFQGLFKELCVDSEGGGSPSAVTLQSLVEGILECWPGEGSAATAAPVVVAAAPAAASTVPIATAVSPVTAAVAPVAAVATTPKLPDRREESGDYADDFEEDLEPASPPRPLVASVPLVTKAELEVAPATQETNVRVDQPAEPLLAHEAAPRREAQDESYDETFEDEEPAIEVVARSPGASPSLSTPRPCPGSDATASTATRASNSNADAEDYDESFEDDDELDRDSPGVVIERLHEDGFDGPYDYAEAVRPEELSASGTWERSASIS